MGWGNCGEDSMGRPIGYNFEAICDHPGCDKEINRGLSYACGGMHGEGTYSCEKYFCEPHLNHVKTPSGELISICDECLSLLIVNDDLEIQGFALQS